MQIDITLYLREVKYTCQVERIVYIQMNPEQRVVLHRIKGVIELLVVLILQGARSLCPERLHIIDNVILICLHILAVLTLGLLAEGYRHCHKLAVLVQKLLNLALLQELLAIIINMEDDVLTTLSLVSIFDFESR